MCYVAAPRSARNGKRKLLGFRFPRYGVRIWRARPPAGSSRDTGYPGSFFPLALQEDFGAGECADAAVSILCVFVAVSGERP